MRAAILQKNGVIKVNEFTKDGLKPDEYELKKRQGLVGDPEKPIYVKDMKMKDRLPHWVKVFTALLIDAANHIGWNSLCIFDEQFIQTPTILLEVAEQTQIQNKPEVSDTHFSMRSFCMPDTSGVTASKVQFSESNDIPNRPPSIAARHAVKRFQ